MIFNKDLIGKQISENSFLECGLDQQFDSTAIFPIHFTAFSSKALRFVTLLLLQRFPCDGGNCREKTTLSKKVLSQTCKNLFLKSFFEIFWNDRSRSDQKYFSVTKFLIYFDPLSSNFS